MSFPSYEIGDKTSSYHVNLRMVPKKSPKTCAKRLSCSRLCRQQLKHAKKLRFMSRCIHSQTRGFGLALLIWHLPYPWEERAATERRSMFCASSAGLRPTQIKHFWRTVPKNIPKVTGMYVSMIRALFMYSKQPKTYLLVSSSTRKSNSNAWNHTFYPFSNFSDEGMETAAISPPSRECTREPISVLSNTRSKLKFRAIISGAEKRNIGDEKKGSIIIGRCSQTCI